MRRLFKLLRIFAGISLVVSGAAYCSADDSAKDLFSQGKYTEALDQLQGREIKSASDYFNAGNCYYRLGKIGQALSYYRKAKAMAPQDSDVEFNLNLAHSELEKRGGVYKDQTFLSGTLLPFARKIPETFVDLLLALCTIALAFVSYRSKKQALPFLKAISRPEFLSVFAVWAFACAVTVGTVLAHGANMAAIVADIGVARSGPAETFTELFKLPAGTEVELTGESREGWRQIRFSLGNMGWIMEKDLLKL